MSATPASPESEAYAWVVRFASGDASRRDLEDLKRWAAQGPAYADAFDRASRTWQVIGPGAAAAGVPVRTPAQDLANGYAVRLGRRAFLGGALAASAAAATVLVVRPPLDLWPAWSELAADYRTDIGERRQIKLFDSVAIDMNTRTSIAMRRSDNGTERIELVSGEALVSTPAQASAALTVVAGDGLIVARDARVNIRRDHASVCVACLAGEVRVERQIANQTLPAGRQLTYSADGAGVSAAVDADTVTAWQAGILIFHATPVSDAIAEVNRYRRGKIIVTNATLGRERFSARLRIENVESVVGQIEQIFGARATALPGGIVLLG